MLAPLTFASTSFHQAILHPLSESLLNLNHFPPCSLPPPPALSPTEGMPLPPPGLSWQWPWTALQPAAFVLPAFLPHPPTTAPRRPRTHHYLLGIRLEGQGRDPFWALSDPPGEKPYLTIRPTTPVGRGCLPLRAGLGPHPLNWELPAGHSMVRAIATPPGFLRPAKGLVEQSGCRLTVQ